MSATTERTPPLQTKLPAVGTTIFTVMSQLAADKGAVNLGQGFPDFGCDPKLLDAVTQAMAAGHNQYPPMTGVPALREAISAKIEALYGRKYDPASEITVTAGATQAIITAVLAVVRPGDEAIVLEPCYDSYVPAIELSGGTVVRVPLTPGTFRPDFDRIAAAISPRTRLVVINSPHNPSGTVWTREEMLRLQDLLAPTDAFVLSDEVYEHMVFDGQQHWSAARFPGLAARSMIVSSFGKTYHVTGWKIGTRASSPTACCNTKAMLGCAWRSPSTSSGRSSRACRPVPRNMGTMVTCVAPPSTSSLAASSRSGACSSR